MKKSAICAAGKLKGNQDIIKDNRLHLKKIEETIRRGPFKDTWKSLCDYKVPSWYSSAKFGIFIHWGVYSVPAFNSEWYSRQMYQKGTKEQEYHIKNFGPLEEFAYKDFIPMFKGENFDAEEWVSLFKKSGAKYIVPVAEHHDGFMMYDSDLSQFTASKMGPCKDIIGELQEACHASGMIMGVSSHRAEHYWFMEGARDSCDPDDPAYNGLYWPSLPSPECWRDYGEPEELTAHMEDWLVRCCDLVERYRPALVYFDWWIEMPQFKPYLKKFAAYYYNSAYKWGMEVAINYKHDAFAPGCAVYDVERGKVEGISPRLWQCDTAIGQSSWGYVKNNTFKKAENIICDFIEIISKNGCMLLNVGPKPDGSIPEEEVKVLKEIGNWMDINQEAVFDTTFWKVFGEGPASTGSGYMTDYLAPDYTDQDIRFTYKKGVIYAFVMKWTGEDIYIKSLASKNPHISGYINSVSILGFEGNISYLHTPEALIVNAVKGIKSTFPVVIKMILD